MYRKWALFFLKTVFPQYAEKASELLPSELWGIRSISEGAGLLSNPPGLWARIPRTPNQLPSGGQSCWCPHSSCLGLQAAALVCTPGEYCSWWASNSRRIDLMGSFLTLFQESLHPRIHSLLGTQTTVFCWIQKCDVGTAPQAEYNASCSPDSTGPHRLSCRPARFFFFFF